MTGSALAIALAVGVGLIRVHPIVLGRAPRLAPPPAPAIPPPKATPAHIDPSSRSDEEQRDPLRPNAGRSQPGGRRVDEHAETMARLRALLAEVGQVPEDQDKRRRLEHELSQAALETRSAAVRNTIERCVSKSSAEASPKKGVRMLKDCVDRYASESRRLLSR
jgi:hypothetical protein